MRCSVAFALATATLFRDAQAADSTSLLRVQLVTARPSHPPMPATATPEFVVTAASFGAPLSISSNLLLPLHVARESGGGSDCGIPLDTGTHTLKGAAVLVDRGAGGCSFVQQTLAAQRAKAALVVVRDSVAGAVAATPTSAFDCALGAGFVDSTASSPPVSPVEDDDDDAAACAQTPTCLSNACVLTGRRLGDTRTRLQVCCFQSRLVRMSAADSDDAQALAAHVQIPAVFLAYKDAEVLERLLATAPPHATAFAQTTTSGSQSPWNVSMALLWLLGVSVVVGAAYHSRPAERTFSYHKVATALTGATSRDQVDASETDVTGDETEWAYVRIDGDETDSDATRFALTGRHALLFVATASASLVLLYYVHDMLLLVNVLFAVGASVAVTLVACAPLATALLPASWSPNQTLALSCALGLAVGAFWFVERTNPSVWPLQDVLSVALCVLFLDTVHLPSLRVGAILLTVAFVYDVFFVYASPFVFGSNVMVDVATGDSHVLRLDQQHLVASPPPVERHETVPMVLRIPLLFRSADSGDALLGLGDVILPGLLVAFCVRYDYCMGYPLSRSYFSVVSTAYAVGLLVANVMAVLLRNVVAGQPALMYIVPLLLASVAGVAKCRGELHVMWNWDGALDAASRSEAQPLVADKTVGM